jgi:hypothetical protein
VRCDAPPTPRQLMAIMRDTYAGTPFDLGRGLAAGPFGSTDRFDAGNGAWAELTLTLALTLTPTRTLTLP